MLKYIPRILCKLTERWWVEWNCLIIYGTGKFSSNIVSYMYLFFFLFLLFLLLFNFFFIQNIFKSTARNVVNISILSTNKQIKFGSVWECFPKVRTDRLDQLFWKINENISLFSNFLLKHLTSTYTILQIQWIPIRPRQVSLEEKCLLIMKRGWGLSIINQQRRHKICSIICWIHTSAVPLYEWDSSVCESFHNCD